MKLWHSFLFFVLNTLISCSFYMPAGSFKWIYPSLIVHKAMCTLSARYFIVISFIITREMNTSNTNVQCNGIYSILNHNYCCYKVHVKLTFAWTVSVHCLILNSSGGELFLEQFTAIMMIVSLKWNYAFHRTIINNKMYVLFNKMFSFIYKEKQNFSKNNIDMCTYSL